MPDSATPGATFDFGTYLDELQQAMRAVAPADVVAAVETLRQARARGATIFFWAFMKVVSSIKSAKVRHPACQVVRRKGKIYVINKVEPRYKARQG